VSTFFGFSLVRPHSWSVSGLDEQDRFRASMERDFNAHGVLATAAELPRLITIISQYPLHKDVQDNTNLMISATPLKGSVDVGNVCAKPMADVLPRPILEGGPHPMKVSGQSFCRLTTQIGKRSYRTQFYTELKGYALSFDGFYTTQQGRAALDKLVNSLQFNTNER
jgi:hypothetical protein